MPDLDLLVLGREDVESILARMVRDVVVGLDPADPSYPDVIGGTFLHDFYGTVSLELDRVYDRIDVEMPQTALPHLTYGEWLDAWAEVLNLGDGQGGVGRKDEVRSTGSIEFTISATAPGPVTIPAGTQVSTEAATDDDEETFFGTLEELTLAAGATGQVGIEALEAGVDGNVPANSLTVLQSGVGHVAVVRNPAATANGADVESDEALQRRVLGRLGGGGGPGNVADYENWALEEPGVGFVTVHRNWNGPGTVRVVITDPANDPSGQPVIDRLQQRLDPPDGTPGDAPIGAEVTVATPASKLVTVNAGGLLHDPGYSLDGAAGTRATRPELEAALRRYVDQRPPGEDVVHNRVIAAIVGVPGVRDLDEAALLLNGVAGDVVVGPLEVAAIPANGITLA